MGYWAEVMSKAVRSRLSADGGACPQGGRPWAPTLLGLSLVLLTAGCAGPAETEAGSAPAADVPSASLARQSRGDVSAETGPRSPLPTPSGIRERPRCVSGEDPFLVALERVAAPGQPVRILLVSESPIPRDARVTGPAGSRLRASSVLSSGPPYARLFSGIAPPDIGWARFHLAVPQGAGARPDSCAEIWVDPAPASRRRAAPRSGVWVARRQWSPAWERVFSAFVAYLFRPIPGRPHGWRPLHQVLRDPARNLLYNRLGWSEDDVRAPERIVAVADCADTPYQLRAYFAWKLSLPFRFRRCTRGDAIRGPRCPFARTHQYAGFDRVRHPVRRFNAFARQGLAWLVHSGTTRTLPEDEEADFYPVPLTYEALRPGVIYVDVGGHVLLVTHRDHKGLVAIDGHPDFSVTERHFGPRFFRFAPSTRTGGFKAFRPIRIVGGRVVPVTNHALGAALSDGQYRFRTSEAFYRFVRDALEGS